MDGDRHAVVVLGPADTPEGRGRIIHAFTLVRDLATGGGDVQLYFEGAGVTCLAAFHVRDNPFTQSYGSLFDAVRPSIAGACDFCTRRRFDVAEEAAALGVDLIGGEDQHHSLGPVVASGSRLHVF